jgi:hypothetical protein
MAEGKLKIAVIDDGINMGLIHRMRDKKNEITCLQAWKGTCVAQYTTPLQMINHGTVCTLILLESLETEKILNDVQIVSISVLDMEKRNNLRKLSGAIQWSIDNKVNLISLSIGLKQFVSADRIIEVSKKAEKNNTIIVAAGANDGIVTYPACLPSVIGVKTADSASEEETFYISPADGIDVREYVPELNVLKKLERDFGYYLSSANSIIAPVVAAQIAEIILREEKIADIKLIKKLLAEKKKLKVISDSYGCFLSRTLPETKDIEEMQIPIIAVEYDPLNKKNIEKLSRVLQRKFIKNEYNCVCISDMISENRFEENRFRLPAENTKEWLCFYESFLNANIIIMLVDEKWLNFFVSSRFIDGVVSEKERHFDCPFCHLESTNDDLASQEIFEWVIGLFNA